MRKLLIPIVVLVVVAVAVWSQLGRGKPVETAEVTRGALSQTVVASGRVATPARMHLGPQQVATVTEVLVREGDRVAAGQPLLRLRSDEVLEQVRQAEAQESEAQVRLRQVEAQGRPQAAQQLAQADANLKLAQAEFQRNERLLAQGFISPARMDEARARLDTARAARESARIGLAATESGGAELKAAHSRVSQSRAAKRAAQERLKLLTLVAPVAATVVARNAEPGDVAAAGKVLLQLVQDGETRVHASVDEKNLPFLKSGMTARAVADAYPRAPFDAELYYIAPGVDAERGSVELRFRVPAPPQFLRPDMTVSVEIVVAAKQEATSVPSEAVADADGEPWVMLLDGDRARRQPVRLGIRGVGRIEISEGPGAGSRLVIPPAAVADGSKVRPRAASGKQDVPNIPGMTTR